MLFGLASPVNSVCLYMVMGRVLSAHTNNYPGNYRYYASHPTYQGNISHWLAAAMGAVVPVASNC